MAFEQIHCRKCGHQWQIRVKIPVRCPCCQCYKYATHPNNAAPGSDKKLKTVVVEEEVPTIKELIEEPIEELPTEELPTEELSTEELSTEELPTEELPTEELPTTTVPEIKKIVLE